MKYGFGIMLKEEFGGVSENFSEKIETIGGKEVKVLEVKGFEDVGEDELIGSIHVPEENQRLSSRQKFLEEILDEMKDRYVTSNKPKVIIILREAIDLALNKGEKFGIEKTLEKFINRFVEKFVPDTPKDYEINEITIKLKDWENFLEELKKELMK
jgi:hypothetical protein